MNLDFRRLGAGRARLPTSQFTPLLMVVVFFGIFYFLLFRPQQKRAKEHQNLVSKLAVGDEVVTDRRHSRAKVTEVGDTFVTLEIADGVRVKVQKVPDHAAHAQGHAEERLRPCSSTPAGSTS